jgi:hypothetical protein
MRNDSKPRVSVENGHPPNKTMEQFITFETVLSENTKPQKLLGALFVNNPQFITEVRCTSSEMPFDIPLAL